MPEVPISPNSHRHIELDAADVLEVGLAILNWNLIEREMFWIVGMLLKVDVATAMVVMSSFGVPHQASVFDAVAKARIKDPAVLKEVSRCSNAVRELSNFRNEIAHGQWWDTLEREDGKFSKVLQKKGSDRERLLSSFRTECGRVKKLLDDLDQLHDKIRHEQELPPLSEDVIL